MTRCFLSPSDHQLVGHGGRHVQEAGEGTRLLRDRRGRGELYTTELMKCEGQQEDKMLTSGGVSFPVGGVQRKSDQVSSHQEPVGGGGVDRGLERQVRLQITMGTKRCLASFNSYPHIVSTEVQS